MPEGITTQDPKYSLRISFCTHNHLKMMSFQSQSRLLRERVVNQEKNTILLKKHLPAIQTGVRSSSDQKGSIMKDEKEYVDRQQVMDILQNLRTAGFLTFNEYNLLDDIESCLVDLPSVKLPVPQ